jgi:hypothetical protein
VRANHEPGYAPVLIREETKQALAALRRRLADRDLNQERRLVTACVAYVLREQTRTAEMLALVNDVVRLDLATPRPVYDDETTRP